MIANREDIRFECAHCAQPFVVEASGAGVEMSCPVCQHRMMVPDNDDFPDREYGARGAFTRLEETHPDLVEALKAATEEKEKLAASATHAQAELKKFQSERQQWRSDVAAHKQRLAAAEARWADLAKQLSLRESELAGARAEIAQTEEELCGAKSELDGLREERAVHRASEEAATAESELKQDNDVLRGIIKRQNDELTQRHAQLKRLKRARFAARILYALLAIALLGTIAFALRSLPLAPP